MSTQESFWEMLVRWFEDAWEFVVKIGEAIYDCVLEVVEDSRPPCGGFSIRS